MEIRAYAAAEDYARCTVTLICDGHQDFGGFGMGQLACTPVPDGIFGQDGDPHDGDAALSFDTRSRSLSYRSDSLSWRGRMVALRRVPKNPAE